MSADLKIVSYNILLGRKPQEITKNLKDFAREGVQIFCLQEVWKEFRGVDISALLLKALGPGWQAECFLSSKPNNFDYGLCMLWQSSTLQSVSFEHLSLPLLPKLKIWEKFVHFSRGFPAVPSRRGTLIGVFNFAGKQIRISTVHLDWQGGLKERVNQISFLKQYLASPPSFDYELLCGDFNTIGIFSRKEQSHQVETLLGPEFKDAFTKPYITVTPGQRLDHLFAKGFSVKDAQVCKVPGSDHFPIMVI